MAPWMWFDVKVSTVKVLKNRGMPRSVFRKRMDADCTATRQTPDQRSDYHSPSECRLDTRAVSGRPTRTYTSSTDQNCVYGIRPTP